MMDFGLVLPTLHAGASTEGIEAGAEAGVRAGFTTIWTTDHLLVPVASAPEYGRIYEALITLAHVGALHPTLRLGTSVLVVPMRQAAVLAKEIATLDSLTHGRVIAGVGVGWNEAEFRNVGAGERFGHRGAYLDEAIALWRHLWSGAAAPFRGRFHDLEDVVFGPLPPQGAALPIVVGGRAPAALRRAGQLGDGYHATGTSPAQAAERMAVIRTHAEAAGRPVPVLSARLRVLPGAAADDSAAYALRGTPAEMRRELAAWREVGAGHLALYFEATDPEAIVRDVASFAREVVAR